MRCSKRTNSRLDLDLILDDLMLYRGMVADKEKMMLFLVTGFVHRLDSRRKGSAPRSDQAGS